MLKWRMGKARGQQVSEYIDGDKIQSGLHILTEGPLKMQTKGELVHQNALLKKLEEVSWSLLDNEHVSCLLSGYSKWKVFLDYLDISLIYIMRKKKFHLLFYK